MSYLSSGVLTISKISYTMVSTVVPNGSDKRMFYCQGSRINANSYLNGRSLGVQSLEASNNYMYGNLEKNVAASSECARVAAFPKSNDNTKVLRVFE